MTKKVIYEISQNIKNDSLVSEEEFSDMYQHSITNPTEFWHDGIKFLNTTLVKAK